MQQMSEFQFTIDQKANMVLNIIVLRLELIDRKAAIDLVRGIYSQKDSRREETLSENVFREDAVATVEQTIKHFTKGSCSDLQY
jgi:hypothetical protein